MKSLGNRVLRTRVSQKKSKLTEAQMENFGDRSRPKEKINSKNEETHPKTPRAWFQLPPPPPSFDISSLLFFCLRGLGFVRKISLVWSLYLIFFCFFIFVYLVSRFDLCFLGFVVELESHKLDFHVNFHRNQLCDTRVATVKPSL